MRFPPQPQPGVTDLPPSAPGMRIGLFGGSFNPPHAGHRLVVLEVVKRLGLDAIWVLVSPGNPLKDRTGLAPLRERVLATRRMLVHPRVEVTGLEAAHGFHYTHDTLSFLRARLPGRRLVWIMGGDSLLDFHRWERWREIARIMPMAVYARPGRARAAPASPSGRALRTWLIDESDARLLPFCRPPAWVYLTGPLSGQSSSAIRAGLEHKTGSHLAQPHPGAHIGDV